jgi:hypothetical protein
MSDDASDDLQEEKVDTVKKYNEALKEYANKPFEYNHDAGLCK